MRRRSNSAMLSRSFDSESVGTACRADRKTAGRLRCIDPPPSPARIARYRSRELCMPEELPRERSADSSGLLEGESQRVRFEEVVTHRDRDPDREGLIVGEGLQMHESSGSAREDALRESDLDGVAGDHRGRVEMKRIGPNRNHITQQMLGSNGGGLRSARIEGECHGVTSLRRRGDGSAFYLPPQELHFSLAAIAEVKGA